MKLSELHTGERGIIVKVTGHGGFRKRIVEMGFIRGQEVASVLNAPLQDPVKYKIMGYEVCLRHSEAARIEIVSEAEARLIAKEHSETLAPEVVDEDNIDERALSDKHFHALAERRRKTLNVALVGNPNCGKTTLFNYASGAHERVGNYSGVTVDAKEGYAMCGDYRINLVDLPGTYSLSAYTPEELYVRKQITEHTPDVVINVIDTSNLERNLYLTTQLIDMHLRMVVALNMFDETEKRGDRINIDKLSELFGMPFVPTVFTTGRGIDDLFAQVIRLYEGSEGSDPHFRHIHINHGHEIEHGIAEIQEHLKKEDELRLDYSTRYLAIKLLETDREAERYVGALGEAEEIFRHRNEAARRVKEETGEDSETAIMDAKYGFIHGALQEAEYEKGNETNAYNMTHVLDKILTNRWVGFPIFILFLVIMFTVTFQLGAYPQDWIDAGVGWLGDFVGTTMPDGIIKDLITDGIIGGVGSVISFLPQILILYLFISFMEDCGYMARAAFIMDKLMHKMGLHGKSFIPLIMGYGCNVPAIMATRTIESRKSRLATMMIIPLISCEARLPVYIMIISTFFALKYQSLIMMCLYLLGVIVAVIMSKILMRFVVKGEDAPFVMELPPYRFPTGKAIARHTWEKGKQYLKKMGGIILVASIIVWALSYFPHHDELDDQEQQEQSYIGRIGKAIEPVFAPQGFNWKLDVGIVAGVGAKEIVAATMGVLYFGDDSFGDDDSFDADNAGKYERLREIMSADGIDIPTALGFLVFVMLYFPCIAAISAIKGETGKWRWAAFVGGYTTIVAWVISAVVVQVARLFV
ncbi:MAG: ferrous iron transport protein B [Prevotella sp.]|nr:ferrous iron transport protein B [Prevotella sp.]